MTDAWHIPNEVSQQVILAAFEDGTTPPTPNFRLEGDLTTAKSQPLTTRQEVTGSYVRRSTPRKSLPSYSGNYTQDLTYEDWPQLQRAGVKAGSTGILVPTSATAYEYKKAPSQNQDDIESLLLQHNVEGLGFQNTGVRFSEHTITIDCDDVDGVWKWASPLWLRSETELPGFFDGVLTGATATTLTMTGASWTVDEYAGAWVVLDYGTGAGEVRQIVSNTATAATVSQAFDVTPTAGDIFHIEGLFEAGVPFIDKEAIASYGTKVYMDELGDAIGTTQILDRIISLNVTTQLNIVGKRFLENTDEMSRRTGRGELLTTFQIRFEFDRRDEMKRWQELEGFKLRIEQEGNEIDAINGFNKLARIDILRGFWDQPTKDARENNLTVTMAGVAYRSTPYVEFTTRNGLATLP